MEVVGTSAVSASTEVRDDGAGEFLSLLAELLEGVEVITGRVYRV